MNYKSSLPIAVLATAALALPAAATAAQAQVPGRPYPEAPVPAGEVQHTVTETTFQSNTSDPGVTPWARTEESWVGASAGRDVQTNTETGELLNEYTSTASGHTGYIAKTNTTFTLENPAIGAASESWQTEGNKIKYEISHGWLKPVQSTTYLGRPAEIYTEDTKGGEIGSLRMVIDNATDYPLETAVTFTYGSQTGSQVSRVTVFEILTPQAAAADLAPHAHPGASISSHGKHGKRRSRGGKSSASR